MAREKAYEGRPGSVTWSGRWHGGMIERLPDAVKAARVGGCRAALKGRGKVGTMFPFRDEMRGCGAKYLKKGN